jgi:competence protein ComEA
MDPTDRASISQLFRPYKPQAVVLFMVVAVHAGGAIYASRVSENAPRVVYSFSLDEAEADAEQSLLIDINTADAERLQELPGVGPSIAEAIIEHRRLNGSFSSVEELDDVSGIGPATQHSRWSLFWWGVGLPTYCRNCSACRKEF